MKDRNREIEKGLEDAKKAEERLTEVERVVNDKIKESKFDAEIILAEAKKQADELKEKETQKTKKEMEAIIERAKKQIQQEKEAMLGEAKDEVGQMVVMALGRILSEKLTKEMDRQYIERVIKDLKH
jgi:F-type H+-transporting ATPase subunit b